MVHEKPIYSEIAKKVRAWTVYRFKRGLGEKEGVVFLRGRGGGGWGWY